MSIKTLKDIDDLGFVIEEVVNNVTESSTVDLNEDTTLQDILDHQYATKNTYGNYDASFIRYQIIMDGTVITELLDRDDLVNFFEGGDYKNYLDNASGQMALTVDEAALIEKIRSSEEDESIELYYLSGKETTILEKYRAIKNNLN